MNEPQRHREHRDIKEKIEKFGAASQRNRIREGLKNFNSTLFTRELLKEYPEI
jgi:hypothetical protein